MSTMIAPPSLQGYRVALTSDADDTLTPAAQLREREAEVLFYPVAHMQPPYTYEELDVALQRCRQGEIDWLLLTTPCAVEAVAERMAHLRLTPSDLSRTKLAPYGAKTRLTIIDQLPGWEFALPFFSTHEELIPAMQLQPGNRVLLPLGSHSRTDWANLLAVAQADVIAVPAYRLLLGRGGDALPGLLWGGLVDAVVFLTENSVRHFSLRLQSEGGTLAMLDHVTVACLDPQTAAAAQAFGLQVQVLPAEYSPTALVNALTRYVNRQGLGV